MAMYQSWSHLSPTVSQYNPPNSWWAPLVVSRRAPYQDFFFHHLRQPYATFATGLGEDQNRIIAQLIYTTVFQIYVLSLASLILCSQFPQIKSIAFVLETSQVILFHMCINFVLINMNFLKKSFRILQLNSNVSSNI